MSKLNTINVPGFYFSGNAAELKFIKQGMLQVASGYPYALLCFDITNVPSDGEILELVFGNGTIIPFVFKNVAGFDNENPLHIPATLPIDFAITAERIAAHIYRHPYMRENYTVRFISYDSAITGKAIIEIKANKRGIDYNITLGGATTVYLDVTYNVTNNYLANDTVLGNYKLKAAVNVLRDHLFNPTTTRVINLEATGIIDVDNDQIEVSFHELPEIARSALGVDIPYNPFLPQLARFMYVLLSIEVNEEYDGLSKKSLLSVLDDIGSERNYTAIRGGLPLSQGNYMTAYIDWGKVAISGQKKFLTYQPRTKLVTREQLELLTIHVTSVGTVNVHLVVYYADHTTDTGSLGFESMGAIHIIPAGFPQLFLLEIPSNPIVKYTITVEEPDGLMSETFTYVIDRRYFEFQRYFIFQNSLGAIDTIRCYGVNTFSVKRKSDTVLNTINSKSGMQQGSIQMVYNQMEQTYTMRTGWLLNKAEKDYLQELLYSRYVAEVNTPLIPQSMGGKYYAQKYTSCIVLQDSIEMWEDSDGLWAMEWKMKLAHDEINYSNATAPIEFWYDSIFEFTILVQSSNDATVALFFSVPHYDIWVDGQPSSNSISINANSQGRLIHIVVKGQYLYDLHIESLDGDFVGQITFKKIETCWLNTFSIRGLNIAGNYLYERVASLYMLDSLLIHPTIDGAAGMDISRMFARVSDLYNRYGKLTQIHFNYSTPTGAAPLIKDSLLNEGLIVNTL